MLSLHSITFVCIKLNTEFVPNFNSIKQSGKGKRTHALCLIELKLPSDLELVSCGEAKRGTRASFFHYRSPFASFTPHLSYSLGVNALGLLFFVSLNYKE